MWAIKSGLKGLFQVSHENFYYAQNGGNGINLDPNSVLLNFSLNLSIRLFQKCP